MVIRTAIRDERLRDIVEQVCALLPPSRAAAVRLGETITLDLTSDAYEMAIIIVRGKRYRLKGWSCLGFADACVQLGWGVVLDPRIGWSDWLEGHEANVRNR